MCASLRHRTRTSPCASRSRFIMDSMAWRRASSCRNVDGTGGEERDTPLPDPATAAEDLKRREELEGRSTGEDERESAPEPDCLWWWLRCKAACCCCCCCCCCCWLPSSCDDETPDSEASTLGLMTFAEEPVDLRCRADSPVRRSPLWSPRAAWKRVATSASSEPGLVARTSEWTDMNVASRFSQATICGDSGTSDTVTDETERDAGGWDCSEHSASDGAIVRSGTP